MVRSANGKATGLAFAALCFAVSCSSPLDRVERLSEVEVSEGAESLDAPAMAAAPEPYVTEKGGLFSRVLGRNWAVKPAPTDADAAVAEANGPEETGASAPAAVQEKPRGLFARLRAEKNAPEDPTVATMEVAQPQVAATDKPLAETQPGKEPAQHKGLFGFLKAGKEPAPEAAPIQTASLAPVLPGESPEPLAQPRQKPFGGLFGRKPKPIDPNAPDAAQVPAGTLLPYGQIARMCDGNPKAMGKEVARYPERSPQYRLYDTAPRSSATRSFLLTGFPDGCARQFTAALALFGGAEMHETLRYGLPAKTQPYSDTDRAYEAIKSQVCRVGKNKPCGAKMSKLSRDTVFLSVYERFGDNARWADILLHDGALVAQDMKSK